MEKRIDEDSLKTDGQYNIIKESHWRIHPKYPNATSYNIYTPDGQLQVVIEDMQVKDMIVKKLKQVYGIIDPWDNDPDYFNNYEVIDKPEIVYFKGKLYRIEADPDWHKGYSLCVYENEKLIKKEQFEDRVETFMHALFEYGIPLESWEEE